MFLTLFWNHEDNLTLDSVIQNPKKGLRSGHKSAKKHTVCYWHCLQMTDWHSCYDARDAIASKNETESEFLWNILQTSKSWQFSMTWFLSILNILHDFNFQWIFFNGLFPWSSLMDFFYRHFGWTSVELFHRIPFWNISLSPLSSWSSWSSWSSQLDPFDLHDLCWCFW